MVNLSDYAEKADDLLSYEGVKNNWLTLSVILTISFAFYLRYLPAQGMSRLQALDPYMIFRMSQHLALEGNLPLLDFSRYFPYATPTYLLNQGDIFIPAFLYNLGPLFFMDYLEWAQIYPAIMGAVGVAGTYLFGKEIFDRETGLAAAFFLASIAGVMHRTSAGFFEKEPTGTALMIFSMFFFVRAWKREKYIWGVLSGLAMALFSVTWGGSRMLWLLYPMTVGIVLWMNDDIKNLIKAYTPLVIIGVGAASAMNPSRFWFTRSTALLNFGMLGLLWGRYLVEELKLVEKSKLKYYTPTVSFAGLIAIAMAPLYSPWLAGRVNSVMGQALQNTGGADIVAGTVAENQAASLSQIAGQLGALAASNVLDPLTGAIASVTSHLNGAWPLAFLGIVFLGTYCLSMIFRKWNLFGFEENIEGEKYYKLLLAVLVGWSGVFSVLFKDPITFVVGPAFASAIAGLGILYSFDGLKETVRIEYEWYYLLPLLWGITNILGAVSRSRLVFLAAFPTAFLAGFMFTKVIRRINNLEDKGTYYLGAVLAVLVADGLILFSVLLAGFSMLIALAIIIAVNSAAYLYLPEGEIDDLVSGIDAAKLKAGIIGLILVATIVINAASGYSSASRLGESPSGMWDTSLDYIEEETPKNSVIMSWWDYGYWFESIGRRAAIADGGNMGYYTDDRKINYPLADYLTSTDPENNTEFLKKHSVDYIVLDRTMIGKYSAVSQIHNRGNDYSSTNRMGTLSIGNGPNSARKDIQRRPEKNDTLVTYWDSYNNKIQVTYKNFEANADPAENEIDSAPTYEANMNLFERGLVQSGQVPDPRIVYNGIGDRNPQGAESRYKIDCIATEDGIRTFNASSESPTCLAKHPLSVGRMIIMPKAIADSMISRLYLMDGHGVDYAEKVPEGSNGQVKMWKVEGLDN